MNYFGNFNVKLMFKVLITMQLVKWQLHIKFILFIGRGCVVELRRRVFCQRQKDLFIWARIPFTKRN